MVVNKHGSFYMRSGWGTKIIQAVEEDDMIFTPSNEQCAIDNIGLGRVIIKALRYWSEAMQLTKEEKTQSGIRLVPETIYESIKQHDLYFQRQGSLLLMHRNLALNIDNATAWYWIFNEWKSNIFSKESFVEGFHAYLAVNGMKVNTVSDINSIMSKFKSGETIKYKVFKNGDYVDFKIKISE